MYPCTMHTSLQLANDGLEQLGEELRSVTRKSKVAWPALGCIRVEVDGNDACAGATRKLGIPSRGVHNGARTDDQDNVYGLGFDPRINPREHVVVELFAKPHDARPLQSLLTPGAVGKLGLGDRCKLVRRVEESELLPRRRVNRCGRQRRAEWVGLVVRLGPVAAAVRALEVEQGAVKVPQLALWVSRPLM